MSDRDEKIFFLEKRIELLEQYQTEMLALLMAGGAPSALLAGSGKVRFSLRLRRFLLKYFSVIDRRLVKYQKYNKIRRWIYRR